MRQPSGDGKEHYRQYFDEVNINIPHKPTEPQKYIVALSSRT